MIVPVILAGGSGTRLWPLSRSAYPKQLLPLVSNVTMLQETVLRARAIPGSSAPIVICHEDHRFLVKEQLAMIDASDACIILEPVGKNTAPAVAIAAFFYAAQYHEDPIFMLLPADHNIKQINQFIAAVQHGIESSLAEKLVTFGVKPTRPETGYGYIKAVASFNENKSHDVIEFVEKPDLATAMKYVNSMRYYWNSGMFMFKSSVFLQELKVYASDVFDACFAASRHITHDAPFYRLSKAHFDLCPSISIDYAVMEKTEHAVLVALEAEWSDVGSWAALQEVKPSDANQNVIIGDVITEKVTSCYLRAESRMLAVIGVKDHIIVETPDAVLVAHRDHAQSVKEVVSQLKQQQRAEIDLHKKVYRPWGCYETVDKSDSFQVKRITVKPGASLSLQLHHHRSEHWVVVSGVAEVTRGSETFMIYANQSTYIPQGVKHRLANPGEQPLELIEVQSGSYLGEDDIVRFDDVYGRMASALV